MQPDSSTATPYTTSTDLEPAAVLGTTSGAAAGTTVLSGWYTDPADTSRQRFWDGHGWLGDSLPVGEEHPDGPYHRPPTTDAMRAEVAAEETQDAAAAAAVAVPLYGDDGEPVEVRVLNPRDWFSSSMTALQTGDFDTWAEDGLAGDDYNLWTGLNGGRGPRTRQIEAFFEEYGRRTGNDPGKSRALRRSLARTARR